ncbi:XrtA/PEP-CTERM system histidine kinase PrsK [Sphingosinicella sp. BN140058]|uniref:XrtA/PEP-CTERM system histidine kinase PrsK n=1 Tax=Sphingosinicella sp. BN140058 TaxID=1892855 RepID=UPI0010107F5C|nr:XrtA/PEP-CTERM system histidine kinase PrsK [Sphingosinicella sp. BN140058]QAY76216.1 PEP-CTERM system histidine kinase PrsK [Sphingosinicella sp. BN140058]
MLGFGVWMHALAALAFGILAVRQLRHWRQGARSRHLAGAFAVTSAWAILVAFVGASSLAAGLAESGRNFAFLSFMYAIVRSADVERQRAVRIVYGVIGGVIGLQITIAGVLPRFETEPLAYQALTSTAQMLGLLISAGALVLVHNLYGQAAPDSRSGLKLPMIALAAMWTYDLHLYTTGYLTRSPVHDLIAFRGLVLVLVASLFAAATRRDTEWRFQLSRAATFQSLSAIAIFLYLMVMMSATRALEIVGGDWVRLGQVGLVSAMIALAGLVLPSGRPRAWLRVMLAKHFFEHRYDYREEWLRFTRTVGAAGHDAPPLGQRVVKAIADIAESPGGLLLAPDENGRLVVEARVNWHDPLPQAGDDAALIAFLEQTAHILDLDAARTAPTGQTTPSTDRLAALEIAWAGVPLLHSDRLVGLVILQHPQIRRALDWEDFDLFRAAGIQAASYLAEARSQEALANAQRFDEFNRRFAFILHDIKNLVSQLSLVARNAERHADNPAFRQDMIATLQSSVKKMNDLLARLSRNAGAEGDTPRPTSLGHILSALAEGKRRLHPVEVAAQPGLVSVVDARALEQAITHLLQNAIDASDGGAPVLLRLRAEDGTALIEIIDNGAGMSAEFIRGRLFQPFASTKDGGFGVGAFEARALVGAIGGRLEVASIEGEGTCFTIILPLAEPSHYLSPERMRA